MSVGGRLKSIIKDNGFKLTEFAKNSQIPYRTLQEYVANKIMPGGESLTKIHAELSVSIDWLLTGEGEPYNTFFQREPKSPEEIDKVMKELKPEQRQEILSRSLEMKKANEMEERLRKLEEKLGFQNEK